MPRNAKKKGPYRKREFEVYTLWKTLPQYFRGLPPEILERHGYSDPLLRELNGIRTQTEFAARFKIKDPGTLTDWNLLIDWDAAAEKYIKPVLINFKQHTIEVLNALRRSATGEGGVPANTAAAALWLKYIEGGDLGGSRQIEAVCPDCAARRRAESKQALRKEGWRQKRKKKETPRPMDIQGQLPKQAPEPDVPPRDLPSQEVPFRGYYEKVTEEQRQMDSYE